MKTILCFVLLSGISVFALSQTQWIAFTDPNPSPPKVTLQSSSPQQVKYTIEIPGMYEEIIEIDTITYQRLAIPKCDIWGNMGYPMLPAISKLIAVPEYTSVIVSSVVSDSVVLDDYIVYPRPEIVEDTVTGTLVEQFTKNDSVYQLNHFVPEKVYELLSDGYLRNQRVSNVAA